MFVAKQNLSPLERLSQKSLQRPTSGRVSKAHDSSARRGTDHSTADDEEIHHPDERGRRARDERDVPDLSATERPRRGTGDTMDRLQALLDQERSASMRVRARMREDIGNRFEVRSRASQRLREHIDAHVDSHRCPSSTYRLDFHEELDAPNNPRNRGESESAQRRAAEAPTSGTRRLNLPDDARERDDDPPRADVLDLLG